MRIIEKEKCVNVNLYNLTGQTSLTTLIERSLARRAHYRRKPGPHIIEAEGNRASERLNHDQAYDI